MKQKCFLDDWSCLQDQKKYIDLFWLWGVCSILLNFSLLERCTISMVVQHRCSKSSYQKRCLSFTRRFPGILEWIQRSKLLQCKETWHNKTKKKQFRDSKTLRKQFRGRDDPKDEEEATWPGFFHARKISLKGIKICKYFCNVYSAHAATASAPGMLCNRDWEAGREGDRSIRTWPTLWENNNKWIAASSTLNLI